MCLFATLHLCSPVHLHVPVSCIEVKELLFAMCANQNCYGCHDPHASKVAHHRTCSGPNSLTSHRHPSLQGGWCRGAPVTRDRSMENAKINGFAKVCVRNDGTCRNKPPFLEIARVFGHFFPYLYQSKSAKQSPQL